MAWTNRADKAQDDAFGYQGFNQLLANAEYASRRRPYRPADGSQTWMVGGIGSYVVKAGKYFIGDEWLTLASDLPYTWTASGANRGMIPGETGGTKFVVYYLYAINYNGAVGIIGSTAYPTGQFNTDLGGGTAFDVNLYLGAIPNGYTIIQNGILPFKNIGPYFIRAVAFPYAITYGVMSAGAHAAISNAAAWLATLHVPYQAREVLFNTFCYSLGSTIGNYIEIYYSCDGSVDSWKSMRAVQETASYTDRPGETFWGTVTVPQTGYARSVRDVSGSGLFDIYGWIDPMIM